MAFRSPSSCLRSWMQMRSGLRGNAKANAAVAAYATLTTPKMKPSTSPVMAEFRQAEKNKTQRTVNKFGDYVPVYVVLGLIALSVSFGLYTARQHLMYSPTVYVRKSKRDTLLDVEDPDGTLEQAEKFIKKSFFRKVAHVQDLNRGPVIPDPIRGDVLARSLRAETLKDVGVDPKLSKITR